MKRHWLLLALLLFSKVTFAQRSFGEIGVLTTVDHPTDPSQGAVLALMTNYEYIPLEQSKGVYIKAREPRSAPQLLSGKEILLDSVYRISCSWEDDQEERHYSFEQLYKGARAITFEGWFVTEAIYFEGSDIPAPCRNYFFLTKNRIKINQFIAPSGCNFVALGGWTDSNTFWLEDDGTFLNPPKVIFTIRCLEVENQGYMITHVTAVTPMSIEELEEGASPMFHTEGNMLVVKSDKPMARIQQTSLEGYTVSHDAKGGLQIRLPLAFPRKPSVVCIEFADQTPSFIQKILPR